MTNPVKLLSDDEVAEIEASQIKRRESLAFHQAEYPNLPTPPYIAEIDSLCATVRALRDENSDLRESVEQWVAHYNEVDKWRSELSISNTALRDQLAALRSELEQGRYMKMFSDTHVGED